MCLSYLWNWLGINATEVIASAALIFTTYQAYLSRKHNRISVRPKLALQTDRSSHNHVGSIIVKLSNSGLGPAEINSYIIEFDGKEQVLNNSSEALDWIRGLVGIIELKSSINLFVPGHILSTNESILVLQLDFMEDGENGWDKIENIMNKISLRVKYSSMYGENFEYHSKDTHEKAYVRKLVSV